MLGQLWSPLRHLAASLSGKASGPRAKAKLLEASGLFDKKWYLDRYPDVASAGVDPVMHYLKHGAAEGRDPGPLFDTLWYLETNPDVAQSGANPLHHFVKFGRREGRTPRPQAGLVAGLGPSEVDPEPASDILPQAIQDPTERDAILRLFEAIDPPIARVLGLNMDAWSAIAERREKPKEPITIVVTHNEITNAHGTGVLVKRIFGKFDSVVTIRPWSSFDNRDDIGFANIWLGNQTLNDQQLYRLFSFLFAGLRARCVVAVPYDDLDLRVALRISEILSAPFVPYVMDDNNVIGRRISDRTMRQAVQAAAVRFVISTEMRQAYEAKFREKFYVLPPLVPPAFLINSTATKGGNERGIIIGNIWAQEWLEELVNVLDRTNTSVDWVCNTPNPRWLRFDREEIAKRGLHMLDPMPEAELVEELRKRPFCILPTSSGNNDASTNAISRLSLPSRVVLVVAAARVPVVVLGDEDAAAARFVRRFGVGTGAPYNSQAFTAAITAVRDPVTRCAMRANATNISHIFSSEDIENWFLQSVDAKQAISERFDSVFFTEPGEIAFYVDPPCPQDIGPHMAEVYRALRRLKRRGFHPDFIVDAGASNGVWSHSVAALYPGARFVLVEPLFAKYKSRSGLKMLEQHPDFELEELALLDREGEIEIQVSGDIYNSSTMGVRLTGVEETIKVPVKSLDVLAKERNLEGRGLVKIDVQYAEHLVIDGGRNLLQNQVDVVVIEMTLRREHPDALTFLELCNKMSDLGFAYEDDAGEWRSPIDGRLEQKDALFIRQDSPFA